MLNFDAVVMLTWSDWFTEMRSNRYHYATRFAKNNKVIFVQPDLENETYKFSETEFENITVLHVYKNYGAKQTLLLNEALFVQGVTRPLLWIYNSQFICFIKTRYSDFIVYHGTEDYLDSDSVIQFKLGCPWRKNLLDTLNYSNLLISVSEGVRKGVLKNSNYYGPEAVITNGADYKFYKPSEDKIDNILSTTKRDKIVFYQGAINNKINFDLLYELAQALPDWTFNFCGKIHIENKKWDEFITLPNVNYVGYRSPEELREMAYHSTVGIIPFEESEWLIKHSFPLKSFEYLSCGLPVVTIPIDALESYPDVFIFAQSVEEFKSGIEQASIDKYDKTKFLRRLEVASSQDYDLKFSRAQELISDLRNKNSPATIKTKLNILFIYNEPIYLNERSREYLESYSNYSYHNVYFMVDSSISAKTIDLNNFDVVITYYPTSTYGNANNNYFQTSCSKALQQFGGYKLLIINKIEHVSDVACHWIKQQGIHHLFINATPSVIQNGLLSDYFYKDDFSSMNMLFVSGHLSQQNAFTPLKSRDTSIVFTEEQLGAIDALKLKNLFSEQGVVTGIKNFGSTNAFDDTRLAFFTRFSQAMIDAIVSGVVPVLFEGESLPVLKNGAHYLSINRDFSNIAAVINISNDILRLDEMRRNAYEALKSCEEFSCYTLIKRADEFLNSKQLTHNNVKIYNVPVCTSGSGILVNSESLSKLPIKTLHGSLKSIRFVEILNRIKIKSSKYLNDPSKIVWHRSKFTNKLKRLAPKKVKVLAKKYLQSS